MTERKARSPRSVLLGLALLVALALTGLVLAYLRLIHYERAAVHHLPEGTTLAVRLDFEHVVLYEPLRQHLFPILDAARGADQPPALQRFQAHTGVNLGMHLRELLVGIGPEGQWTVVVGGLFPAWGLVEGVHAFLEQDGSDRCELTDGRMHCTAPTVFVQQAPDQVLVLASSQEQLERALTRTAVYRDLGLSKDGAGSLVLTRAALAPLVSSSPLALTPSAQTLRNLERVNAELSLGEHVDVRLLLTPTADLTPSQLQAEAEGLLALLRLWATLDPSARLAEARQLLARADTSATHDGLVVRSHYTREELDSMARNLAFTLRQWAAGP